MTIEIANFEAILRGCFIRSTTAPEGPWTQFTQHHYHLVQSNYGKTQHVRHPHVCSYKDLVWRFTVSSNVGFTHFIKRTCSYQLTFLSTLSFCFGFWFSFNPNYIPQCFPPCGLYRVTLSTLWPTQRHITCSSAHSLSSLCRLSTSKSCRSSSVFNSCWHASTRGRSQRSMTSLPATSSGLCFWGVFGGWRCFQLWSPEALTTRHLLTELRPCWGWDLGQNRRGTPVTAGPHWGHALQISSLMASEGGGVPHAGRVIRGGHTAWLPQ